MTFFCVKSLSAIALWLGWSCAGGVFAQETPQESAQAAPAAPLARAPFHIPVIANDHVLIVDASVPAGRSAPWHRHERDFLYALVRESEILIQNWGEPQKTLSWPRGFVGFSAYSKKSVVHRAANVGKNPVRMIGFELVKPAPEGFALSQRPAVWREVIDNERLRGWRLTLAPGVTAPAFRQTAPAVRIVVEGGELIEIMAGQEQKEEQNMMLRPGDFQWRDQGAERSLRNGGGDVLDILEFELK